MLSKKANNQAKVSRFKKSSGISNDRQPNDKRKKRKKPPVIKKTVSKLIPLKEYDPVHEYYVYKDGSIMNLFQFTCKDLTTTNAQDIEMDILHLTKHFRLYSDDTKIISTNIPVDCKSQIDYHTRKIEQCKNEIQKKLLIKSRNEQVWIEKNRLNKEFFYMVFASSSERYEENLKTLLSTLHQHRLIKLLDPEAKDMVLYKLNNKNLRR